jgi:hypothetical protein
MSFTRRTHLSFNRRSLALFASLALGSGLAAAQFSVGPAGPAASAAAPASAPASGKADGFRKLDADGNGSISRKEAETAGMSVREFEALDANRDAELSPAEFEPRK